MAEALSGEAGAESSVLNLPAGGWTAVMHDVTVGVPGVSASPLVSSVPVRVDVPTSRTSSKYVT